MTFIATIGSFKLDTMSLGSDKKKCTSFLLSFIFSVNSVLFHNVFRNMALKKYTINLKKINLVCLGYILWS